MNPELSENETYRYSSRIHHPMPKGGTQLDRAIQMLKERPLTNQAVVEIGAPNGSLAEAFVSSTFVLFLRTLSLKSLIY